MHSPVHDFVFFDDGVLHLVVGPLRELVFGRSAQVVGRGDREPIAILSPGGVGSTSHYHRFRFRHPDLINGTSRYIFRQVGKCCTYS